MRVIDGERAAGRMLVGSEPLAPDAKVSIPPGCKKDRAIVMRKIWLVIPWSVAEGNPFSTRYATLSEGNGKDPRDHSLCRVECNPAAVTGKMRLPDLVFRVVEKQSLREIIQVHCVNSAVAAGLLQEKECLAIGRPVPNASPSLLLAADSFRYSSRDGHFVKSRGRR